MMPARALAGTLTAALLTVTACGRDAPGRAPAEHAAATGAPATSSPVEPPPEDDAGARFSPALFSTDSATIDNPWWPRVTGMRFTYEGHALDAGDTIARRIVSVTTDLSKEVGGVRALVTWEQDSDDDVVVEEELSFDAQDTAGNIWHLGEYVETYEEGDFIGGRVWVVDDPVGAEAGILMPADPTLDDPSFSEGFAPPPWNWSDRGRVHEVLDRTCVEAGCYKDVLVMEEYEPSIPDAFQLKYYARDVGHVQVDWGGSNEPEQEELELVEAVALDGAGLTVIRDRVLAMENRANAYTRVGPVQPIEPSR
jgi:hypothetical protein